ncbi:septum formation family protein [Microbacterium sp. BWT-B31]|uniref:septum formation family protein n=1 Tax=Microbacterium sp. BWT-B31 TaxID=3232072 RepID=UPI00352895B8
MLERTRTRTLTALTTGVILLAALTGCSTVAEFLGGETVERDEETNEVTGAGQADVFNLSIGDCFDDVDMAGGVSDVPAVPCSELHDNEIYFLYDMTQTEFPGAAETEALAEEGCIRQFDAFVGIDYEESVLDFGYLYPSADTWRSFGDREVVCIIYDPASPVTGTLAGAAR